MIGEEEKPYHQLNPKELNDSQDKKGFQQANKEVLYEEKLSVEDRLFYVELLSCRINDKKSKKFNGKAKIRNKTLEAKFDLDEKTVKKRKANLIREEMITVRYDGRSKASIYEFPRQRLGVSPFDVKITNTFIYSDLRRKDKQFIVSLLPHIKRDGDYFKYSDIKLSEAMGGAYTRQTISGYLKRLKQGGYLYEKLVDGEKRRYLNIKELMFNSVTNLSKKLDRVIDERDKYLDLISNLAENPEVRKFIPNAEKFAHDLKKKVDRVESGVNSSGQLDKSTVASDYLQLKALETGELLLRLISEVHAYVKRKKPTKGEVRKLEKILQMYFGDAEMNVKENLYDDLVRALEFESEKAKKGGNAKKYFRMDTLTKSENFIRTIEWNLAEITKRNVNQTTSSNSNLWDSYKEKGIKFKLDPFDDIEEPKTRKSATAETPEYNSQEILDQLNEEYSSEFDGYDKVITAPFIKPKQEGKTEPSNARERWMKKDEEAKQRVRKLLT